MRPYTAPNPPPVKNLSYLFPLGTSKVLNGTVVRKFAPEGKAVEIVTEQVASSAMELD
jgi:hypothetical protein